MILEKIFFFQADKRIDVVTPLPSSTIPPPPRVPKPATIRPNITGIESTICDCPMIEVTSQNAATAEKHGNQLGRYRLIQV